VHTSTVTVAVLDAFVPSTVAIAPRELRERFTRGQGPGGQHKNKTDSCVVLTHLPSGMTVTVDGRDQHQNRREARLELERRLRSSTERTAQVERNGVRHSQVGSGQRGDKVRTYRVRDDRVTDHRTGRSLSLAVVLRGELHALWDEPMTQ